MLRYVLGSAVLAIANTTASACVGGTNIVPNCGFASNITGWTIIAGTCVHDPNSGATALGSIRCDSTGSGFPRAARFSRCLTGAQGVSGGSTYQFGAAAQLTAGANVQCNVQLADFTGSGCTSNINAQTTPLTAAAPPNFGASVAAEYVLGASAQSVSVQVECTSGGAFQMRVDDVFVSREVMVFANGFEN